MPDHDDVIRAAVAILRSGGLVAFPTETVYGLGADATNARAVRRIFEAKGRPATNPLIVHVADADAAPRYAADWPAAAEKLARAFWPGPLTLVVPKASAIVDEVTAGRGTVGLRVPAHPLALELLGAFGGPVAAPSANRSNRVSPTAAHHVREELGDKVDLVLDGGPCAVGIESTVLDLSGASPVILRPGGMTRGQIEAVVGPVEVRAGHEGPAESAASPGRQEVHYTPATPAYRFSRGDLRRVVDWCAVPRQAPPVVVVIGEAPREVPPGPFGSVVGMPAAPEEYARDLYATLRRLDALGFGSILVEMPPDLPEWLAVRDRLARATRPLEPA